MKLCDAKINRNLRVKNIGGEAKRKLRLMELGLDYNSTFLVKHKSGLKRMMLVVFNNSCFTISAEIANFIEVDYE